MKFIFTAAIVFLVSVYSQGINAKEYLYPYLINGAAPSYFTATQSFDSSLSLFENDALSYRFKKVKASMFHANTLSSLITTTYILDFRLSPRMILALGYASISDTNIEKTTINSSGLGSVFSQQGVYSYLNSHSKLSIKYNVSNYLDFGIGFNYYQSEIDNYNAQSSDISFGVVARSRYLDTAFSIQNILNSSVTFGSSYETLPQLAILNFRYKPFYWLYLTPRISYFNSSNLLSSPVLLAFGTHFLVHQRLMISLGVTQQANSAVIKTIPSAGINFEFLFLNLSYVYKYSAYEVLDNSHLISVGFKH